MGKSEKVRRDKAAVCIRAINEARRKETKTSFQDVMVPEAHNDDDAMNRSDLSDPMPAQSNTLCEFPFESIPIEGRRIIEVQVLVDNLAKGCKMCQTPLSLSRIHSELKRGLCSIFRKYCECGFLNKVPTGKYHVDDSKKKPVPIYDVNTKMAGG